MSGDLLQTKLYVPPVRPNRVLRPHLTQRLDQGLQLDHKLMLISAPAGFGKTTLVSEWARRLLGLAKENRAAPKVAWLSLDEGDNDLARFLAYLIAALNQAAGAKSAIGQEALGLLQAPQTPVESVLTSLINDMVTISGETVLILDDYHIVESVLVDQALTFLVENLPPQVRLVMTTREDPQLSLARLRARNQLTELRAADLRFTAPETAVFLNQVMDLALSSEDVAALEARTEGWIAGLQLAAISLQGQQKTSHFIQSFTGSHRFVLDYLVEEVLQQQPEGVQTFLLRTSILDQMCGPLCDAVIGELAFSGWRLKGDEQVADDFHSQAILEYLEQANLFIVPLDNERRWYRYHHLFADLLRQRLQAMPSEDDNVSVDELHQRASQWYEENDLEIEAFQHAAAANDITRAERLIAGKGMPLHFRGAITPVLNWLATLPTAVLNASPSLWVTFASALSMTGQATATEEKLQAAENALQDAEPTNETRNLIGHIAAIRAVIAASQYDVETIITQSQRALDYLDPNNLPVRTATTWKLGLAYQYQGNRAAAWQAFTEAIAASQASGNLIINVAATIGLGNIQEADNQLHAAAESYRHVLQLAGTASKHTTYEAHRGLARVYYQWNDLEAAQEHGQQSAQLARQLEVSDIFVACEVFLARLKLAQGDAAGATALLAEAIQLARQHNFGRQIPEVTAVQVLVLLQQGNVAAAADLAQTHQLPISQARVHLAQGNPSAALAVLEPVYQQAEAKSWPDERLKTLHLQALAYWALGERDTAVHLISDTLTLAEPGGFIRLFVDEGSSMKQLLSTVAARGIMPDYTGQLLAAFAAGTQPGKDESSLPPTQPLVEPLSLRELEVLQLVAQGLSNREIGERLFLALNTVKGHNRRIYGKLQVQRRTEAVARARELGLL